MIKIDSGNAGDPQTLGVVLDRAFQKFIQDFDRTWKNNLLLEQQNSKEAQFGFKEAIKISLVEGIINGNKGGSRDKEIDKWDEILSKLGYIGEGFKEHAKTTGLSGEDLFGEIVKYGEEVKTSYGKIKEGSESLSKSFKGVSESLEEFEKRLNPVSSSPSRAPLLPPLGSYEKTFPGNYSFPPDPVLGQLGSRIFPGSDPTAKGGNNFQPGELGPSMSKGLGGETAAEPKRANPTEKEDLRSNLEWLVDALDSSSNSDEYESILEAIAETNTRLEEIRNNEENLLKQDSEDTGYGGALGYSPGFSPTGGTGGSDTGLEEFFEETAEINSILAEVFEELKDELEKYFDDLEKSAEEKKVDSTATSKSKDIVDDGGGGFGSGWGGGFSSGVYSAVVGRGVVGGSSGSGKVVGSTATSAYKSKDIGGEGAEGGGGVGGGGGGVFGALHAGLASVASGAKALTAAFAPELAILAAVTSGLEDFYKMIQKAVGAFSPGVIELFNQSIENFNATIGRAFVSVFTDFTEVMRQASSLIAPVMAQLAPIVKQAADALGNFLTGAIASLVEVFAAFLPQLNYLSALLAPLLEIVQIVIEAFALVLRIALLPFVYVMQPLIHIVNLLFIGLRVITSILDVLSEAMTIYATVVMSLVDSFSSLIPVGDYLTETLHGLSDVVHSVIRELYLMAIALAQSTGLNSVVDALIKSLEGKTATGDTAAQQTQILGYEQLAKNIALKSAAALGGGETGVDNERQFWNDLLKEARETKDINKNGFSELAKSIIGFGSKATDWGGAGPIKGFKALADYGKYAPTWLGGDEDRGWLKDIKDSIFG